MSDVVSAGPDAVQPVERVDNFGPAAVDAKVIREAASALLGGFIWGYSKEGHEYWAGVRNRLFEIEEIAKGFQSQEDEEGEV